MLIGSAPCFASDSCKSGAASVRAMSFASLSTTPAGVPTAALPNQEGLRAHTVAVLHAYARCINDHARQSDVSRITQRGSGDRVQLQDWV